jgi:hypothetical protein
MAKGPLVVHFGDWTLPEQRAGAVSTASVELENVGTIAWGDWLELGYHWFDDRDNPIVWDDLRAPLPPLAPRERALVEIDVRAPIPPGRYRFAFDLVAEHRAWSSELGSEMATVPVEVHPRTGRSRDHHPGWLEPAPDHDERVAALHAEGFAVVAGAIVWNGGLLRRRPHALAPYEPGPGRVPGFQHPLLCPSVLDGTDLEQLPDVEGLPAFAPPADEPWIYDGRVLLTAHQKRRPR